MIKRLHPLFLLSALCAAPLFTLSFASARHTTPGNIEPSAVYLPMVIADGSAALEPVVVFDNADVHALAHAGDERLFVAFADGRVYAVRPDGGLAAEPLLDITGKVESAGFEQGLLGLAFHPDFATNGYFYVYYSADMGDPYTAPAVLARYTAPPGQDTADPDSERILLTIPHIHPLHYGGSLQFGPDGYLYAAVGDGFFFDYPDLPPSLPNAQNGANLLGKILRLDVGDAASPYDIPPDNPYVDDDETLGEIWMMGLRNPWRMSFDRLTGELYIADVGLGREEEINVAPAGVGGLNFGWPCYEGNQAAFAVICGPAADYEFPVYSYDHSLGRCAVTGGYVYRGKAMPWLAGRYLFTDFCAGEIMALSRAGEMAKVTSLGIGVGHSWTTFGEDAAGEIYLGEWQGATTLYRLVPSP